MQRHQQSSITLSRIFAICLLFLGWTRAESTAPKLTPAQMRLASLRVQLATLANTCSAERNDSCLTGVLAIRYGFAKDGTIRSVVPLGGTIKDSVFLASTMTRFGSLRLTQQDSAGFDSCTIQLFGFKAVSIGPHFEVSGMERLAFLNEHRRELERAIRTNPGDSLPEARIVFKYSLHQDGQVGAVSILESNSHDSMLDRRLRIALEDFKFPRPSGDLIKDTFDLHINRKKQETRIEPHGAGNRSPESILRVIRAHQSGFQDTFQKYLKLNPDIGGKLSFKFAISPAGDVIGISIAGTSTGNQELDTEIMDTVRRMKFPPIEKGNVTVTYAIVLNNP